MHLLVQVRFEVGNLMEIFYKHFTTCRESRNVCFRGTLNCLKPVRFRTFPSLGTIVAKSHHVRCRRRRASDAGGTQKKCVPHIIKLEELFSSCYHVLNNIERAYASVKALASAFTTDTRQYQSSCCWITDALGSDLWPIKSQRKAIANTTHV